MMCSPTGRSVDRTGADIPRYGICVPPRSRRTKPGSPVLAVGYLRVSTEDQRLGPEAQRAQIEAWAARAQITIGAWHTDQGVSGGADLDNRPGLIAALGELRAIGAGVLVVAKRDRLARDVGVAAAIERATEASGARVQSADGTGNGAEASDAFIRTIIDAAAAYERALIRARTKAALAAKKARGERAGNCPFGFRPGVGGALKRDPGEQAALATARQLRGEGRSLRAITRELAARGIVGRTGLPLKLAALARVLGRAELPAASAPIAPGP
jgi:DNA invertase Pin-like site-specific DNA recombinase